MAEIFISYTSSDRPRAEQLKSWFEDVGWSTWIDRDISLGEGWEQRIKDELDKAGIIVVLWGAEARRSEWVRREALAALESERLLQIHATGLPLLPPFDTIQAIRMQSWSGEPGHSERLKLFDAIAKKLGKRLPDGIDVWRSDENLTAYHGEIIEALELAFYYCARQVERIRIQRERGSVQAEDFEEIGQSFDAILKLLRVESEVQDDREGILHRLVEGFMDQLLLLVPDPNALK